MLLLKALFFILLFRYFLLTFTFFSRFEIHIRTIPILIPYIANILFKILIYLAYTGRVASQRIVR